MKYNPMPWKLPYDYVVWKDPKQTYISYCLQLLLVFLLYPIPEDGRGVPPKNYYRHYFGRLHRSQDFEFIVNGMTTILNQPVRIPTSGIAITLILTFGNRCKHHHSCLEVKNPGNGSLK